jgi:ATP-dependent Clp protease adaptor protein ClpS
MGSSRSQGDVVAVAESRVRVKKPRQYRVILLNDDYTPMDFVVFVLETIFRKDPQEAVRLMLEIHLQGRAVCGVYSLQIAEAKSAEVREQARASGHPLEAVVEGED